MTPASQRSHLIRLIHVAKRDLCLTDDVYRDMLQHAVGASSVAKLSVRQLEQVLSTLKSRGFVIKKAAKRVAADKPEQPVDRHSRMVRELWIELHSLGAVRDSTEAALNGFVRRMVGVDALQWLSNKQTSDVIEHLKKWRSRVMAKRG